VTIAAVIVIISVAFSMWSRAIVRLFVHVPLVWLGEHTGIYEYWKTSPIHHGNLERHSSKILGQVERYKERKKKRMNARDEGKDGTPAASKKQGSSDSGSSDAGRKDMDKTDADIFLATSRDSKRVEEGTLLSRLWYFLFRDRTGDPNNLSLA
jgi:hypothetical protein